MGYISDMTVWLGGRRMRLRKGRSMKLSHLAEPFIECAILVTELRDKDYKLLPEGFFKPQPDPAVPRIIYSHGPETTFLS